MREILFRGKRLDNGEWVEGCFGQHTSLDAFIIVRPYPAMSGGWDAFGFYEVDPATVGQYTGLMDRDGNRIFEGDILRIAKMADGMGAYFDPPLEYDTNVVVKWDFCEWILETISADKRYIAFPDAWCHYVCGVIGCIHDNPELLGGDEDG